VTTVREVRFVITHQNRQVVPPPGTGATAGGPIVDVDALPADQAIAALSERLLRLRAGDRIELRSRYDLGWIWRRLDRLDPGRFGCRYLSEGPDRWAMQVTRRHRP
jgi:uncharacterized protein (DUF2249 family)